LYEGDIWFEFSAELPVIQAGMIMSYHENGNMINHRVEIPTKNGTERNEHVFWAVTQCSSDKYPKIRRIILALSSVPKIKPSKKYISAC
jgi:hypothetical protein